MSDKIKIWLKGLVSAIIGGLATGLATYFTDSGNSIEYKRIFIVALSGAAVTVVAYVKQSPIPLKELVNAVTNKDNGDNKDATPTIK